MKRFTIAENDANQRLDKFMQKAAPGLPPALLYKALRTKKIKLNKRRAEGSARLETGDELECWLPDEFFAPPDYQYDFLRAGRALEVLYEDAHVLLLDKPAGLLSHPDESEYVDTLLGRAQRYLYEKSEYDPAKENAFAPALVNRIDRNTQGIVVAAKSAEALRVLNEKMKRREIRKFYLCAVHGVPKQGEKQPDGWLLLRGWLAKDEGRSLVRVHDHPREGAKESLTKYRVMQEHHKTPAGSPGTPAGEISILEIELLTGRTHQIRAQMAAIGHALVGDGKYAPRAQYQADTKRGIKRQCLCSHRIIFDFKSPAGALEGLRALDISVKKADFLNNL
ncbi:MAG: RluA family pseudouridine synthase [Oscillospiraceae bacterium]|nr:RluA family pseudouridine synthase [Oscillospiraceae bacterium]